MNNAQWLYDQIPGPDDEDEGVHLTSAHALQIAGELTRSLETAGKLEPYQKRVNELGYDNLEALVAVLERNFRWLDQISRALAGYHADAASLSELSRAIREPPL